MTTPHRIGLISDTHGLLRPEALDALAGSDLIVHAGDVGKPEILDRLRELAPVVAVRGNVDHGPWAEALPEAHTRPAGGVHVHVRHIREELGTVDPGWDLIVTGHSHRLAIDRIDGVLHVNPGSAGPRRFSLPVTVGIAEVVGGQVVAHVVPLDI
jgi:putative phosphoesterase